MAAQRIKSTEVRKRFGNISAATLYRMWKVYRILEPPVTIRGINYWTPEDVDAAFAKSGQRGE
ncbi:hypothetical protein [Candidatus Magnetaquicoccus inordinatus]|uniref:hypothetical protein n=1 Tax=Candidatus Magnetaquicoccus inordinatus TaxID=2496818 RepID=UPI0012914059|nr:hypothetical protein [Candidatus Magnetaquicoccus inordinatus]